MSYENLKIHLETIEALVKDVSTGDGDGDDDEGGSASILHPLHQVMLSERRDVKEKLASLIHCMLYSVRYSHKAALQNYLKIKQTYRSIFPEKSKADASGTTMHMRCDSLKLASHENSDLCSVPENAMEMAGVQAGGGGGDGGSEDPGVYLSLASRDPWPEYERAVFLPIILAAQLDRTEMLEMLIQDWRRQHHIITSLSYGSQACGSCRILTNGEWMPDTWLVQDSRMCVEMMEAISSPAYILARHQDDPILEAFNLSMLAQSWSFFDPVFLDSFEEIHQHCRQFSASLVDLCETSQEVAILLDCKKGSEAVYRSAFSETKLPRLQLGIDCCQTEFVTHNSCQLALYTAWGQGLPECIAPRRYYWTLRQAYYVMTALLSPLILIVYIFPVYKLCQGKQQRIDQMMAAPSLKYTVSFVSHLVFIIMIVLSVINKAEPRQLNIYQWVVLVWVIGFLFRYGDKLLFLLNPFRKTRTLPGTRWHFKTLVLVLLFLISYLLLLIDWASNQEEPTLNRANMDARQPVLISEIFYGLGSIMAVWEIAPLFTNERSMGSVHVSLVHTVTVIWRFFVLFFLILLAFMTGITFIYSGYGSIPITNNTTFSANDAFTSFEKSGKSLFWSMFGFGDPNDVQLVMPAGDSIHPVITESAGYIIYGIFSLIFLIVLLNMLIALVSNSYDRVQENADREWKMSSSGLNLCYLNQYGLLPPPVNLLLPIRKLFEYLACEPCRKNQLKCTNNDYSTGREYQRLISELKKRYWAQHEPKKDAEICEIFDRLPISLLRVDESEPGDHDTHGTSKNGGSLEHRQNNNKD